MNLLPTITGTDRKGHTVTLTVGDNIVFTNHRGENTPDTVRVGFTADYLLEPYARNRSEPAVVLTAHSWTPLSNLEKA